MKKKVVLLAVVALVCELLGYSKQLYSISATRAEKQDL
jgi:hypothetical protein